MPEWQLFLLVSPLLALLVQRAAVVVVALALAAPYLALAALLRFTPLDPFELVWYVCLPLLVTSPLAGRLLERWQRRRVGLQPRTTGHRSSSS